MARSVSGIIDLEIFVLSFDLWDGLYFGWLFVGFSILAFGLLLNGLLKISHRKPAAIKSWILNRTDYTLRSPSGKVVRLSSGEFAILNALIVEAPDFVSKDDLVKLVTANKIGDTSTSSLRSLEVMISKLRRQFSETDHPLPIKALRHVGYVFHGSKLLLRIKQQQSEAGFSNGTKPVRRHSLHAGASGYGWTRRHSHATPPFWKHRQAASWTPWTPLCTRIFENRFYRTAVTAKNDNGNARPACPEGRTGPPGTTRFRRRLADRISGSMLFGLAPVDRCSRILQGFDPMRCAVMIDDIAHILGPDSNRVHADTAVDDLA